MAGHAIYSKQYICLFNKLKTHDKSLVLFRSTMGHFEKDRKYMNWSAAINLVISIVLGKYFGFEGIMLGTVCGHLCIWYGRMKVVFDIYFQMETKEYIRTQVKRALYTGMICCISILLSNIIPVTWGGILLKGVVITIVYVILAYLLFRKSNEIFIIQDYIYKIKNMRG